MATALATPLVENGHEVRLVGTHLDRDIIDSIQRTGVHPTLGLKVPASTTAFQLEDAAAAFEGVEHVMSGVNSFGVHWAGKQFATLLRSGMHVIALAKGMEADDDGNLRILPHVLAQELPKGLRSQLTFSAVAGPSIAGEVAMRRHTSVVITGEDADVLDMWRAMFATEVYHVWNNTDFIGVEVCAATKNCYAFGAGFMSGVLDSMGPEAAERYVNFNYGAALFGQASIEMIEFMELLGGHPSTPLGLPGIGDCFVTSMGGRNVKCGRLVGSGMTFSEAREQMPGVTLEGAAAINVIGGAIVRLTERGVVDEKRFPLLRHLYEVVGLDQPVNVPWDSFFGRNGSGQL